MESFYFCIIHIRIVTRVCYYCLSQSATSILLVAYFIVVLFSLGDINTIYIIIRAIITGTHNIYFRVVSCIDSCYVR